MCGLGIHEKPHLPEAFHERRMREFGKESGPSLPPENIEFVIGGDAISNHDRQIFKKWGTYPQTPAGSASECDGL